MWAYPHAVQPTRRRITGSQCGDVWGRLTASLARIGLLLGPDVAFQQTLYDREQTAFERRATPKLKALYGRAFCEPRQKKKLSACLNPWRLVATSFDVPIRAAFRLEYCIKPSHNARYRRLFSSQLPQRPNILQYLVLARPVVLIPLMAERQGTTHHRILERGLELVSERGLTSVSLGALAERAGLSKSGLFAHFRSKQELQVELLRAAEQPLGREVVEPTMDTPEGLPRVRALIKQWLGWAARSGLPGGCPLYSAAFELDDAEGPVRDYLTQSKREWSGMLEGLVKTAVASGHLRVSLNAAQFVWQLEGIYLAHHVSQRLMRDPEADARALAAFETLIAASLPE